MAAEFSDFHSLIAMETPDCPGFIMDIEILHAARVFCDQTWIWQDGYDEELELTVDVDGEDVAYEVTVEAGRELIAVSDVKINDTTKTAGVDYQIDISTDYIIFTSAPAADDEVLVKRVYKPALDSTDLPDFLLARHAEAIAKLAVHFIKAYSKKPWSDPAGSAKAYREYINLAGVDVDLAMRGRTKADTAVYPREFGFM